MSRAALALAALLCAGWLAAGLSSSRAQAELIELAFSPSAPPPAVELAALERRARRWNPDRRVRLVDGVLFGRRGEWDAAALSFLAVARSEPANVEAWALTAQAARRAGNDALARRAAARARELNPLGGRRGQGGAGSSERAPTRSAERTTSSTR